MTTWVKKTALFCALVAFCVCGLSRAAAGEEVTVFAAASLTDALGEAAKVYEKETGVKIKYNFAASGTLARQLMEGAPAGVFLSAAPKWTKALKDKDLLLEDIVFLQNDLVLIASKDAPEAKIDFKKGFDFAAAFKGKLSIGIPESVPAGKYAQQALQSLGWWDSVKDRLVQSKDVRETMRVVEMGGADLGIVYKTDAMRSKEVKIIGTFPADSHPPVTYTAGVLKTGDEAAKKYFAFLNTEPVMKIFAQYGFAAAPKKEK